MPLADPGAIADVAAGSVDPDWGNAIRDRSIQHFASATARDAAVSSPTEGMACWLADVDQFLIYNGVAWRQPWNLPWGQVAYAQVVAPQNSISSVVDLHGLTVTWTAVGNRKYRASAFIQTFTNGGGARPVLKLKTGANVQLTTCTEQMPSASQFTDCWLEYYSTAVTAGSTTWKLTLEAGASNVSLTAASTNPAFILITDIGPSGAAA